jgi:hypothetical protein
VPIDLGENGRVCNGLDDLRWATRPVGCWRLGLSVSDATLAEIGRRTWPAGLKCAVVCARLPAPALTPPAALSILEGIQRSASGPDHGKPLDGCSLIIGAGSGPKIAYHQPGLRAGLRESGHAESKRRWRALSRASSWAKCSALPQPYRPRAERSAQRCSRATGPSAASRHLFSGSPSALPLSRLACVSSKAGRRSSARRTPSVPIANISTYRPAASLPAASRRP